MRRYLGPGSRRQDGICSDLNGAHDRFRDMSPPIAHVTVVDLILTQSAGPLR